MNVLFTLWIDLNINSNRRQVIESEIGNAFYVFLNNYLVQHLNVSCICRGWFKFCFKALTHTNDFSYKMKKGSEKRKKTEREQFSMSYTCCHSQPYVNSACHIHVVIPSPMSFYVNGTSYNLRKHNIFVAYSAFVNVYFFLRMFVPDGKNILRILFLQNVFHGILFP